MATTISVVPLTPPASGGANAIASGPGNDLWFLSPANNAVGQIDATSHRSVMFPIPTANAGARAIALGSDHDLYFTEASANKIGIIHPITGAIAEIPIPSAQSAPGAIAPGPAGMLWFTESLTARIGEIDTATRTINEYRIPTAGAIPSGIVLGSDGNVWFTESNATIGRIDPTTRIITEFPLTGGTDATAIASGPDGNLWFIEPGLVDLGGNPAPGRIGTFNVRTHATLQFTLPDRLDNPQGIAAGPAGNLYFTDIPTAGGPNIGAINAATHAISRYDIPNITDLPPNQARPFSPFAITRGPDGNEWFAFDLSPSLGLIVKTPSTTAVSVTVAQTSTPGRPQVLTATVATSPAGDGIATGAVSFSDGSKPLGTAPLVAVDGVARATLIIPLGLGIHAITASYSGDPNDLPSSSSATPAHVGYGIKDDFDGDGRPDPAVYGPDPLTGKHRFEIVTSASGFDTTRPITFDNSTLGYGNSRSIPVPADYFGDGKSAYALWTPNDVGGMTFHADSQNFTHHADFRFGQTVDVPVVADVDGDGRADFGVYGNLGPRLGFGFDFLLSSYNFDPRNQDVFNNNGLGYGSARAIPVVADFDGSGHAGFGLFDQNPAGSTFESFTKDTNFSISPRPVGRPTDIPTAVDISGDGRADLVLYGPGADGKNRFVVLSSSADFNPSQTITFDNGGNGYGNARSIPVPADYEGTGKADFAVFTPDGKGGMEYVYQPSRPGPGVVVDFATANDIALLSPAYLRARKVRGRA